MVDKEIAAFCIIVIAGVAFYNFSDNTAKTRKVDLQKVKKHFARGGTYDQIIARMEGYERLAQGQITKDESGKMFRSNDELKRKHTRISNSYDFLRQEMYLVESQYPNEFALQSYNPFIISLNGLKSYHAQLPSSISAIGS